MSESSPDRLRSQRLADLLQQADRALQQNDYDHVLAVVRRVMELQPDHPPALERLAEAHYRLGQYIPALQAYDRLIELEAATDATWCATGNALTDVGEYAQAVGAYERALELNGSHAEAHHNLGRVLYRLGDVDHAADHLRTAARLSNRLASWLSLATMIPGCPHATHQTILDVRQAFARKLSEEAPLNVASPGRRPRADGPLRVGYVSAHFHKPNYMKPVWGLVNRHDRSAVQVHLFADSLESAGLPGYVPHADDRLYHTADMSNDQLAALIHNQSIDILVDLNAYSAVERLPLYTRPIAPVTLAWFNMYATSALPGINYIVGDEEVIHPDEDQFYTERVLRLPLSYLTFETNHPAPDIVSPPYDRTGVFTFGSLVTQYKITPPVLDAWSEILIAAPRTRLVLANADLQSPQNRAYVVEQFARRGVAEDRLVLRGPAAHLAFLANYNDIDLSLDAFPYNGGTTTMEALWQGVPVLTFEGDRWASRTSQTLLRRAGLQEFVAADVHDYVRRAVHFATAPAAHSRLADLRAQMGVTLPASDACNTRHLARSFESLYRYAHTASCTND